MQTVLDLHPKLLYYKNKRYITFVLESEAFTMPPRAKFTKAQITEAAFGILRAEGMENLTARALGAKLGSSACPIFTAFANMEEVQQSAIAAAKALYKEYVEKGLSETPAFKGVGMQYIQFAVNEPKLFQLLFMTEQSEMPDLNNILPLIDQSYADILVSITDNYGVSEADAERLYRHLWIYTHGIAALCATKMCRFTEAELGSLLTEVFISLLKKCKEGHSCD